MQALKKEVEMMGHMTRCMDAFLASHTRLVVVVDGLDSCEQEKLLQVLYLRPFYHITGISCNLESSNRSNNDSFTHELFFPAGSRHSTYAVHRYVFSIYHHSGC